MEMLVDMGCLCALVQRKLVPEECLARQETVSLQCACGDITEYPVSVAELSEYGD